MKIRSNKYIGDRAFYKTLMTVAVPIMIQNGITNFVGLLDNIMIGRVGTEQMSGVAAIHSAIHCGWDWLSRQLPWRSCFSLEKI